MSQTFFIWTAKATDILEQVNVRGRRWALRADGRFHVPSPPLGLGWIPGPNIAKERRRRTRCSTAAIPHSTFAAASAEC
jgi:hypothetical protein